MMFKQWQAIIRVLKTNSIPGNNSCFIAETFSESITAMDDIDSEVFLALF